MTNNGLTLPVKFERELNKGNGLNVKHHLKFFSVLKFQFYKTFSSHVLFLLSPDYKIYTHS